MKHLVIVIAFGALLMAVLPASAAVGINAGLTLGSLGVGVEASKTVYDKFDLRFDLQMAAAKMNGTVNTQDLNYNTDIKLASWALRTDYHPTAGKFYVSGGLIGNYNQFKGTVTPSSARTIGSLSYSIADQGSLSSKITWPAIAPYIGVGFGSMTENGNRFFVDLGAMFQGSPKVDLSGTGMIAASSANASKIQDDLSGAKTWLVATFGYTFGF